KKCGFKASVSLKKLYCRPAQGEWANGPPKAGKPKPNILDATQPAVFVKMSSADSESAKSILGPSQRACVAAQRALAAGDPKPVARHAPLAFDEAKREVLLAEQKADKLEKEVQDKFRELVFLKDTLEQLQENEMVLAARATAAWAAVSGSAVGRTAAQRGRVAVYPGDPGFVFLMQFDALDSKL
ncbi:unnamed protein product, partial [Prorocentrum cordatum]